jgi:hypothetical protein
MRPGTGRRALHFKIGLSGAGGCLKKAPLEMPGVVDESAQDQPINKRSGSLAEHELEVLTLATICLDNSSHLVSSLGDRSSYSRAGSVYSYPAGPGADHAGC